MFDLKSYLLDKRQQIDAALDRILETAPWPGARIVAAMRYALMSGGKRLRPVLCLAACETVGGNAEQALPVACALEMIHTYSLIHDDLPAMDDDCLRRGRPTCHIAFDDATAILAGDALLTLAFETLSSKEIRKKVPSECWLDIISVISVASGYKGMVEGQMRDMLAEQQESLLLPELEELHLLKTGALIEASVCSGAMLGQGSFEQIASLKVYSKNIGLAFQVADDILNVEGDPLIMGKEAGTDRHRCKSTYPSLLGLSESKEAASRLIAHAIESLAQFDHRADPLRVIAAYIINRNR
ncbi:MAG: polyprenyl synthetase family protein [Deltaproteobacteria bacterium]|nr:polyprenyl synthetase family protein [Deltaproteobacteria bacterium]